VTLEQLGVAAAAGAVANANAPPALTAIIVIENNRALTLARNRFTLKSSELIQYARGFVCKVCQNAPRVFNG
jgi:hypothetical protein